MSLQDRIEALREKHAALERALDEENRRPLPSQDAISDLKRQKLRIKDELYQLEKHCQLEKH
ncbi:MAG: YdcH family protein [Stellaceae bacterium]